MKKIIVMNGGKSPEREVSLNSGKAVAKALQTCGYQVLQFDPKDDSIHKILDFQPDAAFIAMHGKGGEDGSVQGLLEVLGIPYTGSDILKSALCLDKVLTKKLLQDIKIKMPESVVVKKEEFLNQSWQVDLNFPVICKPHNDGSTLGMTIVDSVEDLQEAFKAAFEYSNTLLIEEFIKGKELTVGLLNGKALSVVEIVPKSGFYDFEAKYKKGSTEYFCPARLSKELTEQLLKISESVFAHLELQGAPRVDFILSEQNQPYFLEVNTIPGMTETSLLPKSAKASGYTFEALCEEILKSALKQ